MLYKKMSATPAEKIAVENTTVDSDSSTVGVHFKANDQQFQSLMHSELFAAVTH
jgi:archaellum component FlaF (FlaF/FlaG flagellin family)